MKDILKRYDEAKEATDNSVDTDMTIVDAYLIKYEVLEAERAIVAELIEKLAFWKRRADTRQEHVNQLIRESRALQHKEAR